ncbi:MAG: hypothetical protein PVSMB8_00410 [Vulcanimicrobiaceae bacterium]
MSNKPFTVSETKAPTGAGKTEQARTDPGTQIVRSQKSGTFLPSGAADAVDHEPAPEWPDPEPPQPKKPFKLG